jgi:hypothetical protein
MISAYIVISIHISIVFVHVNPLCIHFYYCVLEQILHISNAEIKDTKYSIIIVISNTKKIPSNLYILLTICFGFESIGLNKFTSLMCYIYVWDVGCNRECQECGMHNLYKLNSTRMGNIASI